MYVCAKTIFLYVRVCARQQDLARIAKNSIGNSLLVTGSLLLVGSVDLIGEIAEDLFLLKNSSSLLRFLPLVSRFSGATDFWYNSDLLFCSFSERDANFFNILSTAVGCDYILQNFWGGGRHPGWNPPS